MTADNKNINGRSRSPWESVSWRKSRRRPSGPHPGRFLSICFTALRQHAVCVIVMYLNNQAVGMRFHQFEVDRMCAPIRQATPTFID